MRGALFSIFEGLGGLAGGEMKSSRRGTIAIAGRFWRSGMRVIEGKRLCNGDCAGMAGDLATCHGIEVGSAHTDMSSGGNVEKCQQMRHVLLGDAVADAVSLADGGHGLFVQWLAQRGAGGGIAAAVF